MIMQLNYRNKAMLNTIAIFFNMKGLENAIRCKEKKNKNTSMEKKLLFFQVKLIYISTENQWEKLFKLIL